jgi:hypothetical protein
MKISNILLKTSLLIAFMALSVSLIDTVYARMHPKWTFQSVDTMKYSRDMARETLSDWSYHKIINQQVEAIAASGANYIAIDTPYDDEFYPVMQAWTDAARRYNMHIWFRGNFSGWEGWFGYSGMNKTMHTQKTIAFIKKHPDLFRDGDIFTSCPECENGLHPDITDQASLVDYKQFLLDEYKSVNTAFTDIHKVVKSNYYSMNYDLAKAIMDRYFTAQMDGVVVIDHYVTDPEKYAEDINTLAEQSGGTIILGEFGAPIPDINGDMTDEQQKAWLEKALITLSQVQSLQGVNYWVNTGGSTGIWNTDGSAKPAVNILSTFYKNKVTIK